MYMYHRFTVCTGLNFWLQTTHVPSYKNIAYGGAYLSGHFQQSPPSLIWPQMYNALAGKLSHPSQPQVSSAACCPLCTCMSSHIYIYVSYPAHKISHTRIGERSKLSIDMTDSGARGIHHGPVTLPDLSIMEWENKIKAKCTLREQIRNPSKHTSLTP